MLQRADCSPCEATSPRPAHHLRRGCRVPPAFVPLAVVAATATTAHQMDVPMSLVVALAVEDPDRHAFEQIHIKSRHQVQPGFGGSGTRQDCQLSPCHPHQPICRQQWQNGGHFCGTDVLRGTMMAPYREAG